MSQTIAKIQQHLQAEIRGPLSKRADQQTASAPSPHPLLLWGLGGAGVGALLAIVRELFHRTKKVPYLQPEGPTLTIPKEVLELHDLEKKALFGVDPMTHLIAPATAVGAAGLTWHLLRRYFDDVRKEKSKRRLEKETRRLEDAIRQRVLLIKELEERLGSQKVAAALADWADELEQSQPSQGQPHEKRALMGTLATIAALSFAIPAVLAALRHYRSDSDELAVVPGMEASMIRVRTPLESKYRHLEEKLRELGAWKD